MKRPVTLTVEKTRQRAPWAPTSILRAGVALRNVVVETYNGFNADRGLDLAGSLAFATLLLAVPLLATFALLFAAFFQDNVNEIVDLANRILPFHAARLSENLREFIRGVARDLRNRAGGPDRILDPHDLHRRGRLQRRLGRAAPPRPGCRASRSIRSCCSPDRCSPALSRSASAASATPAWAGPSSARPTRSTRCASRSSGPP